MLTIKTSKHKQNSTIVNLFNCCMPERFCSNITIEQTIELLGLDGVELDGFVGSFKVVKSLLDTEVPDAFVNHTKIVQKVIGTEEVEQLNDEGELITVTIDITEPEEVIKVWSEYANNFEDDDFAYIVLGSVDENGNKKKDSTHEELVQWVAFFGIKNLLTKSMTKDAMPILPEP